MRRGASSSRAFHCLSAQTYQKVGMAMGRGEGVQWRGAPRKYVCLRTLFSINFLLSLLFLRHLVWKTYAWLWKAAGFQVLGEGLSNESELRCSRF
jgi:hypothetical protein